MAKIERKYLAHYINTAAEGEAEYQRLGKDLEEFSPELAAQVDTKRNILGETAIVISGYEKTAAVEPYYAEAGTGLFQRLQQIGTLLQFNQDVSAYLLAEFRFQRMLSDIFKILADVAEVDLDMLTQG